MQTERSQLKNRVNLLKGKRVLLVGDVGVDEYVMGSVRRISPEAPVPVLEVAQEQARLGLAANVAQNIVALGGEARLVSVVGLDQGRDTLTNLLKQSGVASEYLIEDSERPTTRKLRVMAQHHHIVRVDFEHRKYLSQEVEQKLVTQVRDLLPSSDVVILQDYAKGVLSQTAMQTMIESSHKVGKMVLVDPNPSTPCNYYLGADLMTPNRDEAYRLSGLNIDDLRESSQTVQEVGQALMRIIQSKKMIVTLGKDGMALFEDGQMKKLPTYAQQVSDVTGAGDTVIATIAMGVAAGLPLIEACQLANLAAGVVVAKIGTATCTADELLKSIETHPALNI